jgi:threonine dehydrogenase-like Zn-dependent dehydrogenase
MPQEAVCTAPFQLEWRSYSDDPVLGTGQVRIQAEFAAAKHGTELALYGGAVTERGHWDAALGVFNHQQPEAVFPLGIGNMVVGRVQQVGPGVARLKQGDRVACYGSFKPTHTLAESECWQMPESMPWQSAVCLDPADFALGALRDAELRLGDSVAIFGLGAIGLMAVQMARLSGASTIVAIDPLAARRDVARELGATHALNPREEDVGLRLKQLCDGKGPDVAIEYSGSSQALQAALRGVAFRGTVVFGAFAPPFGAGLDLGAEAHMNVPRVVFSRANSEPQRDYPRWNNQRIYQTCFDMLADGRLTGQGIVSEPVPFESVLDAFASAVKEPGKVIKLGVRF